MLTIPQTETTGLSLSYPLVKGLVEILYRSYPLSPINNYCPHDNSSKKGTRSPNWMVRVLRVGYKY